MRVPARSIWDTGLQYVCSVVSARTEQGAELFMSANFGQVSLTPPRIAINPNRLYPIEAAIRRERRFAINVMPETARSEVARLLAVRRREPRKLDVLGWRAEYSEDGVPYLAWAREVLLCELESVHGTGDHTLMIASVVGRREGAGMQTRPLLFGDLLDNETPAIARAARTVLGATGALDAAKRFYWRLRPPPPADLPGTTYELGGHTDAEIDAGIRWGVVDTSRALRPPPRSRPPGQIGICIVGVGAWGAYYCRIARRAAPGVRLFVCGRDAVRTGRVARSVRADDFFVDFEKAVGDPRVQALALVLPHHEHRQAAEIAAAAGKAVLVEKPIATTLDDADAMIANARRSGTMLMVAEDMHFRPTVGEAARRIALGDVGEPLYLLGHGGGIMRPRGWKADPIRAGGGVLMDIGVHYIRALRMLMGEPASVVASRAMQIDTHSGVEDSTQLMFSSAAGWEAHMLLSWASTRGHAPDLIVVGTRGTLHLWAGTPRLDYYPVAPRPLTALLSYVRPEWLQRALRRPSQQRVRVELRGAEGTGHADAFREFLAAVSERRPPASPPEDARRDLEIVLRAYRALETGERVAIQ